MGSICHFPCALPASIWGHCSEVLFLLAFGAHKKGCDSDTFRAFFPVSGHLETQKHCKTRETQNDRSTLFYPPTLRSLTHRGTSRVCLHTSYCEFWLHTEDWGFWLHCRLGSMPEIGAVGSKWEIADSAFTLHVRKREPRKEQY